MPALAESLQRQLGDVLRELHGESAEYVSGDIAFISPNTQARRLGCCLYILGKVLNGTRMESMLESIPAAEIREVEDNLRLNGYSSGFLTDTKWSIRHYVALLGDLKLLAAQGAVYVPTGRAQFLFQVNQIDWRAPYPMSAEVKRFWFKHLVESDFLGLSVLLGLLLEGKHSTIQGIIRQFPTALRTALTDLSQLSGSQKARMLIRSKLGEIANWKSPEKYAEHLVPPRINWLIDLGMLRSNGKDRCEVSAAHRPLAETLAAKRANTSLGIDLICLQYAAADGLEATDAPIVEVVDKAFRLSKHGQGLMKIRLNDLITFLVCNHPGTLVAMAEVGGGIMSSLAKDRNYSYQLYSAQRQTQAYMYRTVI